MPTQNDTKNIAPLKVTEPVLGSVHATSTDDVSTTYTIQASCKISDFAYYQPSGSTTTVTRRLGATAGQDVVLLSSTATSGAGLSGRALTAGDTLIITQSATSGAKGYDTQFEAHRAG